MLTVKSFVHALTDPKHILDEMRIILRETDSEYSAEETAYTHALQVLQNQLPSEKLSEAMDLINLQEYAIASDLLFLLWNGLQLNLKCFHQPIFKCFLQLDYENIHREGAMQAMANQQHYWNKANSFHQSLTSQQQELFDPITSYYAYIQTTAYKLAHYFGFMVGDRILPKVEPGYLPDHALSISYGLELRNYLRIDTQKLIT